MRLATESLLLAGEAIKIMLQERKMSNKINYDVLKTLSSISNDLFGQPGTSAQSTSTGAVVAPKVEEEDSKNFVTVIESGPVVPRRNLKRNQQVTAIGDGNGASKKSRSSKKAKEEHPDVEEDKTKPVLKTREVKVEDSEVKIPPIKAAASVEEYVIESGPVLHYNAEDERKDYWFFFVSMFIYRVMIFCTAFRLL